MKSKKYEPTKEEMQEVFELIKKYFKLIDDWEEGTQFPIKEVIRGLERDLIGWAIEVADKSTTKAADFTNIKRSNFIAKMHQYDFPVGIQGIRSDYRFPKSDPTET